MYSKSVHLGNATVAYSIDDTFHPTFLPQQAIGTSEHSANSMYPTLDVSQTFANRTYRRMQNTIMDVQSYGTGLFQGEIRKIQGFKGLMNKYYYYHTNPDEIIKLAIYNSINGDSTLLDSKLDQLRTIDSLANIKF